MLASSPQSSRLHENDDPVCVCGRACGDVQINIRGKRLGSAHTLPRLAERYEKRLRGWATGETASLIVGHPLSKDKTAAFHKAINSSGCDGDQLWLGF